jgi:LysM repeat protein
VAAGGEWRRYAAPAAFLLAVTIAVVLVRSGLEHRGASATPPTTVHTTTGPVARRYWKVRAGDTFAVIARKTGVSVATIQKLNPKASSTALFIGEKIRYR